MIVYFSYLTATVISHHQITAYVLSKIGNSLRVKLLVKWWREKNYLTLSKKALSCLLVTKLMSIVQTDHLELSFQTTRY